MMSRHLCWSLLHVAVEIAGPVFSTLPLVTVTGHRPSTCSLIFPASIQPSICTSDYSALATQPSVLLPPPFTITMAQIDLMEVAEATAVESAILWQVQTVLEALLPTGELDAWPHGVGLAGAIGELKSEVERMETVVNGVKGRAVGNKPLARSLARVKELMYDADDVVDELDYCRLQHQVERGMYTSILAICVFFRL